jgi:hypothetical protein
VKEVEALVKAPQVINSMEEASRKLARGDAAVTAVDLIEQLVGRNPT